MNQVVYIDVLVGINFIVNLMLLNLTQKLTGVVVPSWRRYLGAFFGSLFSFVVFLPLALVWWHRILVDVAVRVLVTVAVIVTTFFNEKLVTKLKLTVVFFTSGFIFAGVVIAVYLLVPNSLLTLFNGVYYINVSPLVLVMSIAVAYIIISLFGSAFNMGSAENCYDVKVVRGGVVASFRGFMDTGNQLVESFSGLPVMVVDMSSVGKLLTEQEMSAVVTGKDVPASLRPIFYNTVGYSGILYGFKADDITIVQEKSAWKEIVTQGYVAVATWEINCENCSGVFGRKMLNLQSGMVVSPEESG